MFSVLNKERFATVVCRVFLDVSVCLSLPVESRQTLFLRKATTDSAIDVSVKHVCKPVVFQLYGLLLTGAANQPVYEALVHVCRPPLSKRIKSLMQHRIHGVFQGFSRC